MFAGTAVTDVRVTVHGDDVLGNTSCRGECNEVLAKHSKEMTFL